MKKIIQVTMPFIAACFMLCIILYLAGASNQAAALSSSLPGEAILVTTLEDELNVDGDCSLREAIAAANNNTEVDACPAGDEVISDTIKFDVMGTITVTSQLSVTAGGPLVIDGAEVITTSGRGTTRIWWVENSSELTLQNLVVADGYVNNGDGAGLYNNGGSLTINKSDFVRNRFTITDSLHHYGGGIYSTGGILNVFDSRFEQNGSGDKFSHGGGIANINTAGQILRTTFKFNSGAGCRQGIPCSHPGGGGYYQKGTASATIQNSIFSNNTSLYGGGGIAFEGGHLNLTDDTLTENNGSGMDGSGDVTISSSNISSNSGGGIYTWGFMSISNTTFLDNGNIGIINMGTITITNSTFTGNHGSGIYNNGSMSVASSTFNGNNAQNGGGIFNEENIRFESKYAIITNCTFSGNTSMEYGGGVYNSNLELSITNTTFFANSAGGEGGGIYNNVPYQPPNPILLTLTNTIITNSLLGGDCGGNNLTIDRGHNISSDNTCGLEHSNGSLPNTDPLLGPLKDNGGLTWTHALLWGSPAIDAGDNAECPPTDQRGLHRPLDGNGDRIATCDIGSFEFPSTYLREVFLTLVNKFP